MDEPVDFSTLNPQKVVNAILHGTEEEKMDYDDIYEAAITKRNFNFIEYLFTHGVKPYVINSSRQTVIHLIYYNRVWGNIDVPRMPIYADGKNFTDKFGLSHFHVACCVGDIVAVEKFLQDGTATVNDRFVNDPQKKCTGFFPIHFAIQYGRKAIIDFLISKGASVNSVVD